MTVRATCLKRSHAASVIRRLLILASSSTSLFMIWRKAASETPLWWTTSNAKALVSANRDFFAFNACALVSASRHFFAEPEIVDGLLVSARRDSTICAMAEEEAIEEEGRCEALNA